MLKVLIVDDEAVVRRGIVLGIDWASLGCAVVGEAANGEEGLAAAAQALNDAALQAMQWNADDYSSFVIVSRDGEGNILSMQADAQKINLLAR